MVRGKENNQVPASQIYSSSIRSPPSPLYILCFTSQLALSPEQRRRFSTPFARHYYCSCFHLDGSICRHCVFLGPEDVLLQGAPGRGGTFRTPDATRRNSLPTLYACRGSYTLGKAAPTRARADSVESSARSPLHDVYVTSRRCDGRSERHRTRHADGRAVNGNHVEIKNPPHSRYPKLPLPRFPSTPKQLYRKNR